MESDNRRKQVINFLRPGAETPTDKLTPLTDKFLDTGLLFCITFVLVVPQKSCFSGCWLRNRRKWLIVMTLQMRITIIKHAFYFCNGILHFGVCTFQFMCWQGRILLLFCLIFICFNHLRAMGSSFSQHILSHVNKEVFMNTSCRFVCTLVYFKHLM